MTHNIFLLASLTVLYVFFGAKGWLQFVDAQSATHNQLSKDGLEVNLSTSTSIHETERVSTNDTDKILEIDCKFKCEDYGNFATCPKEYAMRPAPGGSPCRVAIGSIHIDCGPGYSIGPVAFPVGIVCSPKSLHFVNAECYLCNADCIYAHNAYSGKCLAGADSETGTTYNYCSCDYHNKKAECSSSSLCGLLSIGKIPLTKASSEQFESVVKGIVRYQLTQNLCSPIRGCKTDCGENHGSGEWQCVENSPLADCPDQSNTEFCECNTNMEPVHKLNRGKVAGRFLPA